MCFSAGRAARRGAIRQRRGAAAEGEDVNKQIFSMLGTIGASPYMLGAKRLNSQYARLETLYEQGEFGECVSVSGAVFAQLMQSLYLSVTGENAPIGVILSDIEFWQIVGNQSFCDTAGMLQYALDRFGEGAQGETESGKAASVAKNGLDTVIGYTERFLSQQGRKKCLDPIILNRDDVREHIVRLIGVFRAKFDNAGCSGGFSMQPPYMNAGLLDFPEEEIPVWARYIAVKLQRAGLLTTSELRTLDARQVVDERVGLTNEYIRRATAGANGGALIIEHFEEFDMPCLGGNLLDRALRTTFTAAEKYRGSLCIIVSGKGENVEKTFERAERGAEYFPLVISLREKRE